MDLKAQLELQMYDLSLFEGRAEQNEHHKVLPLLTCLSIMLSCHTASFCSIKCYVFLLHLSLDVLFQKEIYLWMFVAC